MKTKFLIIAFVVTALLQLAIPGQMVYENELAYTQGNEYKFKTEPVDPTDPFRGKYISLNFEADEMNVEDGDWAYGDQGYVLLGKDKNGFAYIKQLSHEKPEKGDYVKVAVDYNYDGKVTINYPFNRFYMEESKAPDAEIFYRENNTDKTKLPAYALVSVNDDVAVIKDVILDGIPVKEYVEKHRK